MRSKSQGPASSPGGAVTAARLMTGCMVASGAAGLMCQVVWARMLALVAGNTVHAVSMVVAAFLAGLALGSRLWGARADRMANPLGSYVRLELGAGAAALAVSGAILLLDDVIVSLMTVETVASGSWQFIRFMGMFALLLTPTMLMGGTLPVMLKAYVRRVDAVGRGAGVLYAANTYGAVIGCFLAGFIFIRFMGVWGTLALAVSLNALAAALAWKAGAMAVAPEAAAPVVQAGGKPSRKTSARAAADAPAAARRPVSAAVALWLSAFSGFTALAFEILWTRAYVVTFNSTVYLFAGLLGVYLLGVALGSQMASRRLDAARDPLKWFGLAQVGVGVWGALSVFYFGSMDGVARELSRLLGEMNQAKDSLVMLSMMAAGFLVPAALFGISYPLILRAVTQSLRELGSRAGLVYAVGTLGGIAGALAAGFALLPWLGLQNGVFAVSALAVATGYAALFASGRTGAAWALPAPAAVGLVTLVAVNITGMDIGLGPAPKGELVFAREGVMGTVRVAQERANGPLTLLVNNYQLATSGDVAVRFGHMPLILAPDAKETLLISLGSGITAGSVGAHPVERIDCVEIVPTLLDVQPLFAKDNHQITADRRFHLTFWDGRHYARVTRRQYDVVIADLFQPDSAGVGFLYSREHFETIKAKLKPGGAMAQWLPLYQLSPENLKVIMATFASVFPHTLVFFGDINTDYGALLLYGSPEPIRLDPAALMSRLESPGVKDDMIENTDPLSFLSFYVMDGAGIKEFTKGSQINTDNRPVIEYTAPGHVWKRREYALQNFALLAGHRRVLDPALLGAADDQPMAQALAKYFESRTWLIKGRLDHANRDYPREVENYRKAVSLAPTDPFLGLAVFDLGYVYFHRGDYASAINLFEWARSINPALLETYFYLAKAHENSGNKERALQVVQALAKINPDVAQMLIRQ